MNQQVSKKTILVVDDVETNIDILVELLGTIYEVKVALDGETALEEVAKEKPDLILLDIMMPDMNGYEVCRKIKGQPDLDDIPIIFLTAKSEIEDEAKGLSMGAVDYIVKPFNPEILRTRIRTHLLLKDQHDQLKQSISILAHRNELLEQKAEIGIQTGGLAHDMANILTIGLSIEYLLPKEPPEDKDAWAKILEEARQIGETVKLGVDICKGFTSYLKDIGAKESTQHFDDLLPVINMYGRQFNGELIREIDSDAPPIKCKAYQIKRVLVNLFVNALQAVQDSDAPQIRLRLWEDDGQVHFSIRDNGYGISPAVLPRIFEERFTTKDKGTGLGLFLVKQIVDSHEGFIEVISQGGEGTEFILSFPACP